MRLRSLSRALRDRDAHSHSNSVRESLLAEWRARLSRFEEVSARTRYRCGDENDAGSGYSQRKSAMKRRSVGRGAGVEGHDTRLIGVILQLERVERPTAVRAE